MPRKNKTNLLGEATRVVPQGHERPASAEQSEPSNELPSEAKGSVPQGQPQAASAGQPLDQRIALQQEFAVQRRALNRAKGSVLSQAMAVVRRALGWYAGDEKDAREGMNKRAKIIVDNYCAGRPAKPEDAEIVAALAVQLDVWRDMAARAKKRIKLVEKEMENIAATLPGYGFVQSVLGFGTKTFAIIVGEAGDLGAYPKKGHLWKRLGLAPYEKNGVTKACSQWAREGGLDKDDWIAAGYKRDRRADIFACLGQSLIRGNGDGKYRTAYLRRKEYERVRAEANGLTVAPAGKIPKARAAEFMSLGHIDRRAQRYMEQRAIHDLWKAWRAERRADIVLPETAKMSVPVARPDEEKANGFMPETAGILLPSPQPNAAEAGEQVPPPYRDEQRANGLVPETANLWLPVARLDEEKADGGVPYEEAYRKLPSPQPNAAQAITSVPESAVRTPLPAPQPNAAEASAIVPESEAALLLPPLQKKEAA